MAAVRFSHWSEAKKTSLTLTDVTISPRFGTKNAEPSFAPSIKLDILPGTNATSDSDFMIVDAVCHNCRDWGHGKLDITSKAQPMFYAFGPGNVLQSDSKSADLRRHARYGFFTMDMTAATGPGGVPANSTQMNGAATIGDIVVDHSRTSHAHTIMGCLALFIIWPLNVLVVGFFKNIKIHIGLSVVIVVFLIISIVLGISTSYQFNRVSHTSVLLPILLL